MEPAENKQIALQKAVSAHEQAAASLADLMGAGMHADRYEAMLARIRQNIDDLHADVETSRPGDRV